MLAVNFDCCCSIIIKISSKLSIYSRYWIANWVLMPWRRLISINTLNKKKIVLRLVRQSSKEVAKEIPRDKWNIMSKFQWNWMFWKCCKRTCTNSHALWLWGKIEDWNWRICANLWMKREISFWTREFKFVSHSEKGSKLE